MRDMTQTSSRSGDVVLGDDWVAPESLATDEIRESKERRGLLSLRSSPLTRKIVTLNLIALVFLFSGIVVAVDLLPMWSQVISRVSPMYYANEILQEIIGGESISANLGAAAGLPVYGLVILGVATITLRERH